MRSTIAAAFFIFILTALGCATPRYALPPPARDADAATARMAALVAPYPAEFRMSQRIILSVNGKEYDFIGYLAVTKNHGFRAMAFGDMGGRVFDFVEKDGVREILSKPDGMPSGPLLRGVMGDIRHLFMVEPEGAYAAAKPENGFSLILKGRGGAAEFIFSGDGLPASSLEVENETPVREASYSGYRVFDGWEKPLPGRIVLVNRRWGYQLRIELLKMDAIPMGGALSPSVNGER